MENFLDYMTGHSLDLYRNTTHGTLLVRVLLDNNATTEKRERRAMSSPCPETPVALVTEHRLFGSRQHTMRFDLGSTEVDADAEFRGFHGMERRGSRKPGATSSRARLMRL